MATYDVKICAKCRKLIIGANAQQCPICKEDFDGNEVGTPEVATIMTRAHMPAMQDINTLLTAATKRKPPTGADVRKAFTLFAISITVGPLAMLFGQWVIRNFRGPGVIFFGYGALIAGPAIFVVCIIWGLNLLLRDGRKKTIEKAFEWIWDKSYYAGKLAGGVEKAEQSAASALRAVPSVVCDNVSIVAQYIEGLRTTIKELLDEQSAAIDLTCLNKTGGEFPVAGWSESEPAIETRIDNQREIQPGVKEVWGTLKVTKKLSRSTGSGNNSDTYILAVSAVEVKLFGIYVSNGKYWFPFDLLPEIHVSGEQVQPEQLGTV